MRDIIEATTATMTVEQKHNRKMLQTLRNIRYLSRVALILRENWDKRTGTKLKSQRQKHFFNKTSK